MQRISDLSHPPRKVDLDHLDRARYKKDQQKPELGVVYEAEALKLHCCGVSGNLACLAHLPDM